jgi:hypothetical protein
MKELNMIMMEMVYDICRTDRRVENILRALNHDKTRSIKKRIQKALLEAYELGKQKQYIHEDNNLLRKDKK